MIGWGVSEVKTLGNITILLWEKITELVTCFPNRNFGRVRLEGVSWQWPQPGVRGLTLEILLEEEDWQAD